MSRIEEKDSQEGPRLYRLMAIELTDVCPRRCIDKANLLVLKTQSDPDFRFRFLSERSAGKWYSGHIVRQRQDLVTDQQFLSSDDAKIALRQLIAGLSSDGYTVNRDSRVWSVYVIELDPRDLRNPRNHEVGYVYVGETCKPHDLRFAEHLQRKRNKNGRLFSKIVAEYGIRLRADLQPTENRFFDKESSKIAEAQWAEHLSSIGYRVEGGH